MENTHFYSLYVYTVPCVLTLICPCTVTLDWFAGNFGYSTPEYPVLAICYESGRMQLMRTESDSKPVLVDTLMTLVAAR